MPLSLDSRPSRKEGVLAQTAAENWVLLDLESGEYYALDEVSSRIWHLCDGQRSIAEIAETVHREYDAPTAQIERDALAFLCEMAQEGLVSERR